MASSLPDIESSVIDEMFDTISSMEVKLDKDPLEFGPKRLNEKTAIVRDHLTACERMFGQVSHWLQLYKRAHRAGQLEFELTMQDMLANDPEVRAGRNVADRNAIAVVKVRDSKEDLDKLQVVIQDLDAVMTVIKSKRADLRDLQSRLRDQKNLCQEAIHLGAKWGSKIGDGYPSLTPVNQIDLSSTPVVDSVTMQDLQRLMSLSEEPDMSKIQVPLIESTPITVDTPKEEEKPPFQEIVLNKVLKVEDLPKSAPQNDIDAFLDEIDVSEQKRDTSKDVSIDELLGSL